MDTSEILKKIRTLEIKTRGLVETAFAGDYHSVFKGRGMNFEDVREYQPGDEIRAIDWNVTARMGTAFVKKFTEERELTVMLVVDVSASGNFGSVSQSKRELAAEVACLLAFSAIRNNDKVGLVLFTDRVELFIPPKKGRSHTLRLIREILFFEPQGRGTEPALALDYLNKIVTRRAVVFFISDFQAPDFSRALAISGRRHDFVAIHIHDEREKALPNIGIITLEDAETGDQIEINTADRATRTRFSDLVNEQGTELSRTLRRNNIDAIALQTGKDYLPPLTVVLQATRAPARCSMKKNGGVMRQLFTAFTTMPMSIFAAEEFHDIAPPVDYSLIPPWLIFLGVFVSLTVIGLLVWFIARALRRPAPIQSPRDRALAILEQMRPEIEKLDPYRFSIRVSDILRRYVTEQFKLPVTRQTSVEFLAGLRRSSPFSEDEKSLLEDFLNRCDLIKFARYEATSSDSQLLLDEAFRFVEGGQLATV